MSEGKRFSKSLCQGFGSCRIARHRKCKRGFARNTRTGGSQLQSLCCRLPGFRSIAVSRFSQSSIRQIDGSAFLVVDSYGGVHGPLGQFSRLAKMTGIRLGIGCERQSIVLIFGLAGKPLLLFRHRRGVRSRERQAHTESCGIPRHPVFAPAPRG